MWTKASIGNNTQGAFGLKLRREASSTECDEITLSDRNPFSAQVAQIPQNEMLKSSGTTEDDGNNTPCAKRWKISGGMRSMLSQGRTDWETMMAVGGIFRRKHSRMKGNNAKIRHVLHFIFQPDVTQLLAWGTIRIKCGRRGKYFPASSEE